MAVQRVVVWAWLIVISAATDDTFHPHLLPGPLLLAQGRTDPRYILGNILPPQLIGNSVQEQDLITSEEFSKGGAVGSVEASVPGYLLFPTRLGNPAGDSQVYDPNKAAILTHLTSSSLLQDARASNRMLRISPRQRTVYPFPSTPRKDSAKPHRRQKRYTFKHKLRSIAVPLSVFNFLGFLPVRVPGLPYHNDLPSPDYSYYDTKYDVFVPRYRRRKTFRRF